MKTGIVFSGGAAKGAWQVGVLWQLIQKKIVPDMVYGTSVGAINAAGYAYCGAEKLLEIWKSIRGFQDIARFHWGTLCLCSPGIFHTRPLRKLLDLHLKGEARCEAVACRVSLKTGAIEYVSNRDVSLETFKDAVQASAAIPVIMCPVGEWVDGGIRDLTPLKPAIRSGVERLIVVLTAPISDNVTTRFDLSSRWFRLARVGYRAIADIMEHEIFLNDIQTCLLYNQDPHRRKIQLEVYVPPQLLDGDLFFRPNAIARMINAGCEATPTVIARTRACEGTKQSS